VSTSLAQEFGELVEGLIRAINDSRKEDADLANRLKVIITSAETPAPWADDSVFLGGEVAGRINHVPSVAQRLGGSSQRRTLVNNPA